MVKDTRILFELKDLVTIRVRCVRCPNEIVLRPGPECIGMPEQCLNCGMSWVQGSKPANLTRSLVYLLSYIQTEVTDPPGALAI